MWGEYIIQQLNKIIFTINFDKIIKRVSIIGRQLLIKQIMGNEPTKNQNTSQIKTNTLNHPILKNAKVISNGEISQLQLLNAVPNNHIYNDWQQRIQKYVQPNMENQLIFLPKSVQYDSGGICGTTGVIKAIYSYPPLLLSQQLDNRMAIMQPFTQQQIWYLLCCLSYAASANHNKNTVLGDIRPRNIFLFSSGDISISCLASFYDEASNYQKSLKLKQKTFLAPEQVIELQANIIDDNMPTISQNFSIGMTLMSLMLLHDEENLYFSQSSVFDSQKFKKQTSYLAHCQQYSQLLKQIVLGLLESSTQTRITSQQIVRLLSPYQQSITNLNPFKVDDRNIQGLNLITEKLNKIKLDKYQQAPSKIISYNPKRSYMSKSNKSSYIRTQQLNNFYQTPHKNGTVHYHPQLVVKNGLTSNSKHFSPNMLESSLKNNVNVKTFPQKTVTEKTFLPTSSSHKKLHTNDFQIQDSSDYRRENKVSKSVDIRTSYDQAPIPNYKEIIPKQSRKNSSNFNVRFEDSQVIQVPYRPPRDTNYVGNGIVESKISFSKKQNNNICFLNASPLGESVHEKSSQVDEEVHQRYTHLQQIGRQTKSINNPSQYRLRQPQSIKQMLKSIDEQVLRSQQMFPGQM